MSATRRVAPISLGVALAGLVSLPAAAATSSVSIQNFAFHPDSISVHIGDTVTWTNNEGLGGATHTVTADGGSFGSGDLMPGNHFSFSFNKAGSFSYYCMHHTYMTGTVTVLGASPSPTPTHRSSPTPTPTHSRTKPTATAAAKPTAVPVSPTPTSSVKPSPRVSGSKTAPVTSPTPTGSRVVAAGTSSSSATGVTIGLIAGALVILGGGLFIVRRRRTVP